jgi:hypothetical protein
MISRSGLVCDRRGDNDRGLVREHGAARAFGRVFPISAGTWDEMSGWGNGGWWLDWRLLVMAAKPVAKTVVPIRFAGTALELHLLLADLAVGLAPATHGCGDENEHKDKCGGLVPFGREGTGEKQEADAIEINLRLPPAIEFKNG